MNRRSSYGVVTIYAMMALVAACDDTGSSVPSSSTGTTTTVGSSSPTTTTTTTTPTSSTDTVALAAPAYSASAGSAVQVEVKRTGATTDGATVSYSTVDGTAAAGTDYTAAKGTLQWAAGDTASKMVSVTLAANSAGNKSFSVALSNPVDVALGTAKATVTIKAAATTATGADANLSVRVQGDHFIDSKNVTLQLRGVNTSALEFVSAQGWSPTDPWGGQAPNFNAIKTWKSNTVRIPLNEASWLGYQCADSNGGMHDPDPGHNYQATVKKAVSDATAAGLYVILDLHWTAPKNFCPLAQNPMADADNSINFWTSIATTFKSYPNVIFELFNEPYIFWMTDGETDWKVLMQGGTMTKYVTGDGNKYTVDYSWKTAGMQQMLDAIRKTGATNVVMAAGLTWAQDLSQWVANAPTDPLKQLAAVWHPYPNSNTLGDPQAAFPKFGAVAYTWTQSVLTGGYPVFATEFGDHDAPGTVGSPFVSKLLPWNDEHGVSYTGWTWDVWGDSDNVLIKDASGTPTDGYGAYVKQHYICVGSGNGNCQ